MAAEQYGNAYVDTDTGYALLSLDPGAKGVIDYFTRRAVIIMGRMSFDPKAGFGWRGRRPQDWRISASATLLGVANQPVLYDDRWRRAALWAGLELPGYGWLDRFLLEGEWYPSPVAVAGHYRRDFSEDEGSWMLEEDHPFTFSLLLAKDVLEWLSIQARLVDESRFR